jgi:hypothetical protein
MKSTEKLHIKGLDMVKEEMESITFSQFIEETFNAPLDEIFNDLNIKEVIYYEEAS